MNIKKIIDHRLWLQFDVKKDKDFLAQISKINDIEVITAQTYRGKSKEVKTLLETGKALLKASSQFKPDLFGANLVNIRKEVINE